MGSAPGLPLRRSCLCVSAMKTPKWIPCHNGWTRGSVSGVSPLPAYPVCDVVIDSFTLQVAQQHVVAVLVVLHLGLGAQTRNDGVSGLGRDDLVLGAIEKQ